mgnify:CR=1 FL=1
MKKTIGTVSLMLAVISVCSAAVRDHDAVYNRIEKEYTLSADGSQSCRTVLELTYNSYHAIHSLYGETFIDYNPQWQELVINSSFTKLSDGTKVLTPENAFVPTLPGFADSAPAHNGLVRMVVVHTGLEKGCKAYLDYTIISRPGYLPELDFSIPVETDSPIDELKISVTVPEGKKLAYSFSKNNYDPVETSSDGTRKYVWNIKDVGAASSDPGGYRKSVFSATTFPSFEDAFSFLKEQFIKENDLDSATTAQLLANGPDDEKIASVNRFLRSHLDIVPIPLEAACYKLRSASQILESAYATPAEREVLRCALLKASGVKAEIVPICPSDPVGLGDISGLMAKAVSEAGELSTEKTFSVTSKFGKDDLKNGYLVAELQFPEHAFKGTPYSTYPSSRTNELLLHRNINEVHEYEILLQDGIVPSGLEKMNAEISNGAGFYSVKADRNGDRVTVRRTLEIYKSTVSPAEYPDFMELISVWSDAPKFIVRKP